MFRSRLAQSRAQPSGARLRTLLCAVLLTVAAASSLAQEARISETQIKAAFLYNFTKFVEWPADVFADADDPIVIGILGESPLADALSTIVENRKVNGRPIAVVNVGTPNDIERLQMLFVGKDQDQSVAALLTLVGEDSILTIGETTAFAAEDGAIVFVRESGKLRFEINMTAAERARLKISAELQKLATVVKRAP